MKPELEKMECKPCAGGIPPLTGEALQKIWEQLGGGWDIAGGKQLQKTFKFPDFRHALDFVNRVGAVAEKQGHHPDIFLAWGEVRIQIWTHSAGGLTENDFILAAKINGI